MSETQRAPLTQRARKWFVRTLYYGGLAALAYCALLGGQTWAANLLPFVLAVSLFLDVLVIVAIVVIAVADPAAFAKMREDVERKGGMPRARFAVMYYLALALALAAAGWFILACVALAHVVTAWLARGVWNGCVSATVDATP